MRIVALSDTHTHHSKVTVPDGDVLVFGGDFMSCGRKWNEVVSFADWFTKQPHKYKVFIAGNHDRLFESNIYPCLNEFRRTTSNPYYLSDNGCVIDGVKFWGSPYTPWFYNWAFNVYRGEAIKAHWDKIPTDTDVLVTHGPPYGILDRTIGWDNQHVGCKDLETAVQRVKPKVHIFGHIHAGFGVQEETIDGDRTRFHNVSICDEGYNPVNPPHVIDL